MSAAAAMQIHSFRGASSRAFVCQSGSTLWRSSYSKVSPFALVDVVVNDSNMKASVESTITVPRNGDLLANGYVYWKLPFQTTTPLKSYVRRIGQAMLKKISISIGTQKVDQYTDVEAVIQDELMGAPGKELVEMDMDIQLDSIRTSFNSMFGRNVVADAGFTAAGSNPYFQSGQQLLQKRSKFSTKGVSATNDHCAVYVPLMFWFCQSPSSALPLVSLMYHSVQLEFRCRDGTSDAFNEFTTFLGVAANGGVTAQGDIRPSDRTTADGAIATFQMIFTYVMLSNEEREKMANSSYEQLICQHQNSGNDTYAQTTLNISSGNIGSGIDLYFNHPVTAMFWVGQSVPGVTNPENFPSRIDRYDFRNTVVETLATEGPFLEQFASCQLLLNSQARFADSQDPKYFRTVQPYQHFNKVPKHNMIYAYSFAQAPCVWCQPSGHLNFSRIDTALLKLTNVPPITSGTDSSLNVWVCAWSLNILRFSGGVGGTRYSV